MVGPIAQSLARLDAGVSWTTVTTVADDRTGWVRCSALLTGPGRFLAWQREVAAAYGDGVDDAGLLTGQGLVLDAYLAAVLLPAVGAFHLDRRVPDLTPALLAVRPGAPGSPVAAVAVESARFGCLVDDPSADDAGAYAVGNLTALAGLLRTAVLEHAEALLAAYAPTTRIGRHGLWAAATDAVDVALMVGGSISRDMARARADAGLVLGPAPLVGGSTLHQITDDRGRTHWTRRRYSCCYVYRASDQTTCVTCPRVSDEDRRWQAARW